MLDPEFKPSPHSPNKKKLKTKVLGMAQVTEV
jgi:hypothetical protein